MGILPKPDRQMVDLELRHPCFSHWAVKGSPGFINSSAVRSLKITSIRSAKGSMSRFALFAMVVKVRCQWPGSGCGSLQIGGVCPNPQSVLGHGVSKREQRKNAKRPAYHPVRAWPSTSSHLKMDNRSSRRLALLGSGLLRHFNAFRTALRRLRICFALPL